MPREIATFYETILRVMTGTTGVTRAAEQLGMARSQFQSSLHKAQRALIAALPSGRTGRPKKCTALRTAEATIRAQQRRIERQGWKIQALEARLDATSSLIRSEMSLPRTSPPKDAPSSRRRSPRSRSSRVQAKTTTSSGAEPDGTRAPALVLAARLEHLGYTRRDASLAAGVPVSTSRRWRSEGLPRCRVWTAARPRCDAKTAAAVRAFVRESDGLFGADALRRRVEGVSRRDAAAIKKDTLRVMERERRAKATRIEILSPGVLRGFDAMHLTARTRTEVAYSLLAQDGSVPYITSIQVVERYDGEAVLAALERDFADHGAPYVLRLDRAAAHRTPSVRALCESASVLMLHGPPRCARFYGQLERMHRDLRVFAPLGTCRSIAHYVSELERVRVLLNRDWCRRSLGYDTAEARWNSRVVPVLDRRELRDQVLELTARIGAENPEFTADECHRHAVVAAMAKREFLRQIQGGHR